MFKLWKMGNMKKMKPILYIYTQEHKRKIIKLELICVHSNLLGRYLDVNTRASHSLRVYIIK